MPDPFAVEEFTLEEITAVQRLHNGEATEHQQKLALAAIVNKLCRTHDLLYVPGSFDQTGFLNGRAFVGARILKVLNMKLGELKQKAQ